MQGKLHIPAAVTGLDVFAAESLPLAPIHAPAKGQLTVWLPWNGSWRDPGSTGSGPLCLQMKEIWAG